MLRLKGGQDGEGESAMTKALGIRPENQPSRPKDEMVPTGAAFDLGMPSARKYLERDAERRRRHVNWGDRANRIDVGRPVYVKGKTELRPSRESEREIRAMRRRELKTAQELKEAQDRDAGFSRKTGEEESDDSESDLDFSDEDELFEADRARRLAAWKAEYDARQKYLALGHGKLTEIKELEFLPAVTGESKQVVCHFYHSEFERCKTLDRHLEVLAKAHLETRFLKLDAQKAPFFVEKLKIRVLPTLVSFKDGIAVHRLIGFEGLGGDDFSTRDLENHLHKTHKIIGSPVRQAERIGAGFFHNDAKKRNHDLSSDSESDSDSEEERRRFNPIRRGGLRSRMHRDPGDSSDDSD